LSPDGQHAAVTTNQDGEVIALQLISLKDGALHSLDRWAWSRETATVTGQVSGVAWSIEGNLYFSKAFWATITDQKVAGPIVTCELWRVDTVAKAPALIISRAPFYRVLAVEPRGMGAYVTILVSGYESWRSEALAYLDFGTGHVTPIWHGAGVGKPYSYAIRVAQTGSKMPAITLQYEEQVPGLTAPIGAITLLTLDPGTNANNGQHQAPL
jgi:hypothetical protein